MKLATLTVCDAAAIRDGLLSTIGAGLNIFGRSEFPAPVGAVVASLLVVEESDEGEHEVAFRLTSEAHGVVHEERGNFTAVFDENRRDSYLPVVVDLHQVAFPDAGTYNLEYHLDGDIVESMRLYAETAPAAP